MPRHKRIDIPGAVHHVIVRGLNRQAIFVDDKDRRDFLKRLENGLSRSKCQCLAWALLDNHFHLLIRTGDRPLTHLMRIILTGYAIYFNRRHNRHGYLFQNRYKSILCQEEEYLLELLRYIHLNPIRAGIVRDMEGLDRYPWSGHAVLMGHRRRKWQERQDILVRFGAEKQEAASRYRLFVMDGIAMGRREELTGGGLRRSAGGWERLKELQSAGEYWRGDERILGDGHFVDEVLRAAEEALTRKEKLEREGWLLERLVTEVCDMLSVDPGELWKKGRENNLSYAKGLICYLANVRLGVRGKDLARYFKISQPSISQAINRGERFARENDIKLLS